MSIADLAADDFFDAVLRVATVGAAFGFFGTLLGGVAEAIRSLRAVRPAEWGNATVYGGLFGGLIGTAVAAIWLAFG